MRNSARKKKISKQKKQDKKNIAKESNKILIKNFEKIGYKPKRITDIWQNYKNDSVTFTFLIQHEYLQNQNKKKSFTNKNLHNFEENFKLYLLTEFRNSLQKLSLTFQLGEWALKKLDLLKKFCKQEGINMNSLRTTLKIYKKPESYAINQIKDDYNLLKKNVDLFYTNRLQRKKQDRKFSLDENDLQNFEPQNSQNKVKKAEYLKTIIEKINELKRNCKNKGEEHFMKEFAQIRNYFFDLEI